MKNVTRVLLALLVLVLVGFTAQAGDIKSAGKKGNWSAPTTWVGGVVPSAADNVIIADGDTVTIDANVSITNITVGEGGTNFARLTFSLTTSTTVTVTGNILVAVNGGVSVSGNTINGNLKHDMTVYGDITCNDPGGQRITGVDTVSWRGWDLKSGSTGSTLSVCNVIFTGSKNSTITLAGTNILYNSENEFSGITINKSGTARVILKSDVYVSGGSSSQPAGVVPVINFVRGLVETGRYALVHAWTDAAGTVGMSDSSYVLGNFGRGISNGGTSTRDFPIGDAKGYRPARIHNTTAGVATGHHIRIGIVTGNANTGSSTFAGGIDKVSAVRYYTVMYCKGLATNPATMTYDKFGVSYGSDDGVATGNGNLRVAVADSTRKAWTSVGPAVYTTLATPPSQLIYSDVASPLVTLNDGQWMTVALARVTGTTENSLTGGATAVEKVSSVPAEFALEQNYPNPFNPSTAISYQLSAVGFVTLKVFDALGREVATLVQAEQSAGRYRVTFDASNLTSGTYFCRLQAGNSVDTKKLLLVK
jgi:hypothetical protein